MIGWAFSAKPDAELVIKALDMAYEQRGRPQQVLFHSAARGNALHLDYLGPDSGP